ncbi:hypothetical protein QKU58_gp159 [Pyramimonas orientalis virus]|uniref:Uncharacterized protein n=1 Tax=Pyramimonas orientalis virus 01B TaxID=3134525 RepID=A0A7M4CER4_9VIRU|nr:hypothetical protein QKU58_gp159 [Pyramimonas orientalis virus]QOI90172.1 hypothetical protein HWQ62_00035 [Pyramimonas orientalis virus]
MTNVYEIVEEVMLNKQPKQFYLDKYPEFSSNYPYLLNKLYEDNFDKDTLRYMLNQKQKIDANKSSEYDASVKVGTVLVDKYVKPNLN